MMNTVTFTINGYEYTMQKGINILEASFETRKLAKEYLQHPIPTLYYLKGIVDVDESGVCIVEANGEIVNASTTRISDGMTINTDTPEIRVKRKEALGRILSVHNKECLHCFRDTNCELQELLHVYGFTDEQTLPKENLETIDLSSKVLIRDNNKCIRCKRCVNVCAKIQAVSAIAATGQGLETIIMPSSPKGLSASSCVNCGQCVAVCPVGALTEKEQYSEVQKVLGDPDMYVVAQVAPAVRTALGENFEFPIGVDVEGRIAAALRKMGFDKVFDTKAGADLTIMEEANELVHRIKNDGVLPMITSCCPAWVKYAEHFYPELLPNISTCKSPHMMEGAIIKSYFAEKEGIEKDKIAVVSIMPCTAKKFEITREEMQTDGVADVDYVITTNELAKMLNEAEIQFAAMEPYAEFDNPLGYGTGAAVIFGRAGGVSEAALRTAKEIVPDAEIKYAAVSGLANANALIQQVKNGESDVQLIEVMACPGGCVNGGGQPHQFSDVKAITDVSKTRADALNKKDADAKVRNSHENEYIQNLYKEYLGEANGEKAHQLLHTTYRMR